MGQAPSVVCDFSTPANYGDTCQSMASDWGLTVQGFQDLNPGVACPDVVPDQSYCVIGTVTYPSATTTLITTTTTGTTTTNPSTTSTTSSSPYSPTQPGLVSNCNNFYRVASQDTCQTIEGKYGISPAQFSSWNPYINASKISPETSRVGVISQDFPHRLTLFLKTECDNLWLDYYVCVGVPGATTTTAAPPTQTPSGPQPQMPGIISSCKRFREVQSGDSCYVIDNAEGISLSQFLSWNSYVDAQCDNLWLGYYVCVSA